MKSWIVTRTAGTTRLTICALARDRRVPAENRKAFAPVGQSTTTLFNAVGAMLLFLLANTALAQTEAPVANAGPNQTVNVGSTVTLNGSGSYDPGGQPLTYLWTLQAPGGTTAVLSNPTTVSPTFVADVPGTYVARLIVNNGSLASFPSTVTITASPAHAQVVDANADVTINLQFPSELTLPATGPWLTGTSFFTAGILNGTQFVPMSTSGAATYNIFDPNPPQTFKFYALGSAPDTDVDVWQFGGTVNTTAGSFPTVALPPGSTIPTLPPSSALITVTNDLTQGFEPYHVTGPIVAWPGGPAIQIGTYDILVSPAPDLNQQGLTGSWYERATSGQGLEVEVFPDPTPGTGSAQVSWFTYDTVAGGADHQRWYTLRAPVMTGQPNACADDLSEHRRQLQCFADHHGAGGRDRDVELCHVLERPTVVQLHRRHAGAWGTYR